MPRNVRSKNWTFTINNPTGLIDATYVSDVEYMVYQEELAETGTPHLQGYVRFKKVTAFSVVKERLGPDNAHIEVAQGTPKENKAYCSKETFPGAERYEYGECPANTQGQRTDLLALRDNVKAGRSFMELANDDHLVPTLARHMNFYNRLTQEARPPVQRPNIAVRFCVGGAGTGKSTCAGLFDDTLGAYAYDRSMNGFWDGYSGQKVLIFDEMNGAVMAPTEFNRICDKGPYRVNIKNGSAPLIADDIRITANYMPDNWWKDTVRWNKDALTRRIHEAHYHEDINTTQIFMTDANGTAMSKLANYLVLNSINL